MATSTTAITKEMKKMMSIFSINKRNSFDKINMHLKEGTKRIMEDAGRTFLKRKQEALTTTTPPELVDAVASKVFTTTSPSMEPQRSTANTHYYNTIVLITDHHQQ